MNKSLANIDEDDANDEIKNEYEIALQAIDYINKSKLNEDQEKWEDAKISLISSCMVVGVNDDYKDDIPQF